MKTSIFLLCSICVTMLPAMNGQGYPITGDIDLRSPAITSCPDDITVVSGSSPATATWTPPTAMDDRTSQEDLKVYNNYNPGDLFNFGATTVTYAFTDEQSNSASCTFNVIISQARKKESDELHRLEMALKSLLQDDEQLNEQAQKENALKKKAMAEEAPVKKDVMDDILDQLASLYGLLNIKLKRDEEEIYKMALKEEEEEQLNELALKENEEEQNEMLSEKKEADILKQTLYSLLHK